jgi:hypothetical protein
MKPMYGSPTSVSWGPLEQGGWPQLSLVLAVEEADGQPPERQHADVLTVAPAAEATSDALTVGCLTAYTALAAYLVVERAAKALKDDRYAAAVARH